uniref:WGS project CBMG000000000 data, contig CS5907-c001167 n=1 Tax=Fusarium acuminatum CS5907 TaxID=1318461 RepID=A0A096PF08_9HYPO|nr:unnamed protein product [Fusarium acuminatum CS5907]
MSVAISPLQTHSPDVSLANKTANKTVNETAMDTISESQIAILQGKVTTIFPKNESSHLLDKLLVTDAYATTKALANLLF